MSRGVRGFRFDSLLFTLVVLFVGGLIALKFITAAVYAVESKKGPTEADVIHAVYANHVKAQKDPDKLAKIGENLTKRKNYYYAALNFKQASDLDTQYRDAAYGWAYATMQEYQDDLTATALADIKTGLSRAEKVDPYFEPMLRMKLLVAQLENNQDVITATQARMSALGIK